MPVFQTFYVSRAARPLDDASIEALLLSSRRGNAGRRITGCLLFSGRCFAQVLEGERGDVQSLVARVARDPRHTDVRVLSEGRRDEREYSGWTMGYLRDTALDDDLETLLMIPQRSVVVAADVMERMRPDPVMGALR
ncbi:MAG TPA: BLUF domain-containing protein [Caldimonas sp.]|jgi:hypothetical protein|nr:BLUF domain-containing protein [Caldimonas sp.]HEX4233632.1 BLUF domain-containing protein [Caldimonas sp.]